MPLLPIDFTLVIRKQVLRLYTNIMLFCSLRHAFTYGDHEDELRFLYRLMKY